MKLVFLSSLFVLILFYPAEAQDIGVTTIGNDVLILHPAKAHDLPNIRRIGGTVTAIRTDSGMVIIDSFSSLQTAKKARNLILEYFPNSTFEYLINTHHHDDHILGNQCFSEACLIVHKNLLKHQNFSPTIQITSDTILSFGNKTFEILYFGPAHTDNDLIILDKDDRLLIMGDLFCYKKCYLMGPQSDVINWIVLLDKLINRRDEYDYVIPGHCGIFYTVKALIEQSSYLKTICETVENAKSRNLTLEQAKRHNLLQQYKSYMMFDKIGLDIERYWNQIEK